MKNEIRKFTISYSKKLAKERKENKTLLKKLKELQDNLSTEDNNHSYIYIYIYVHIYIYIYICTYIYIYIYE